MTVKEMIALLSKYPEDTLICTEDEIFASKPAKISYIVNGAIKDTNDEFILPQDYKYFINKEGWREDNFISIT